MEQPPRTRKDHTDCRMVRTSHWSLGDQKRDAVVITVGHNKKGIRREEVWVKRKRKGLFGGRGVRDTPQAQAGGATMTLGGSWKQQDEHVVRWSALDSVSAVRSFVRIFSCKIFEWIRVRK